MKPLAVSAEIAWQFAANEAGASAYPFIEREHLFIGICSLAKASDSALLATLAPDDRQALDVHVRALDVMWKGQGVDPVELRRQVRAALGRGSYDHQGRPVSRSPQVRQIFERAEALAKASPELTALHLLQALLESPGERVAKVFFERKVEPQAVLARVADNVRAPGAYGPVEVSSATPLLDQYGRDLTREAREGKLGPFVGRRKELLTVIQTLARAKKNNPIIVGEAGVGKTAVVEALAVRIAEGKEADILAGKRIVELNLGALVAGTQYRGEFEQRLRGILDEAKAEPNLIVFLDEIHTLVGAGAASDKGLDAANMLKPALARGEFRLIGATTLDEYRQTIEADPALDRRFEKVVIEEPGRDEALEMLKVLRARWQTHHGVEITDGALAAAVDLSIRYEPNRQLPDKAIDLVDKAGSRSRIPMLSMLKPAPGAAPAANASPRGKVTEVTVAEVLAERLGVPADTLAAGAGGAQKAKLLGLERFLQSRLIGQDEAVAAVTRRLTVAYAGLKPRRGPVGVMLFLGPTGVGKTELAKLLAEYLYDGADNLVRFDMSEFQEQHSTAKLIGSPPGYIGHEEEGQLTGALRARPYSVILFDEIEKAHPQVFDLFLQLFDEGRLTDTKGRMADARHALILLTSNAGSQVVAEKAIGFGAVQSDDRGAIIEGALRGLFRPELLNRIDEKIVFKPLGRDEIKRIALPMVQEICRTLFRSHGVELAVSEAAVAFLAEQGYHPAYGARQLRRTIETLFELPVSRLLLGGELAHARRWEAKMRDGGLVIERGSVGA
jgi:ATP-dependent Clp protease ATP-binding subunit ClpC